MRRTIATIVGVAVLPLAAAGSALFTAADQGRLTELIRRNDAAKADFDRIRALADAAMQEQPHPITIIQTEHKLAGDPAKLATQAALKDMRALFALGYAYEVTGFRGYSDKSRTFILAWARHNRPTGDPIDETNLEPLIVAYDLTRGLFPAGDRSEADGYLRRLIAAEWNARQVTNNWQSHRLKIVGLAAYALGDDALIAKALAGFKAQIEVNLNPDGSSTDFLQRDALHYHVYDLEPLLTFAIAAQKHGLDLYDYTSARGASLRRSVLFLLPYCTGEKQHAEFVHSTVKFDRERAANGEKEYRRGHLFNPEEGLKALALAAYFDDAVGPAVISLLRQNRDPTLSWTLLLNAASRPAAGSSPAQ